jgi:hypothetical protein
MSPLLHACVGVADGWESNVEARRAEHAWRHLVLLEASVPGGSIGTDGVPIRPEALSRAMRRGVKQLPTQPGFVSRPLGLTVRRLSLRRSDGPKQMTMHALVQPPHLFCCLASPDFPEELAKRLCDELALLWLEEGSRVARLEEGSSWAANQISVSREGGGEGGTSSTHAAGGPGGLSDALATLLERHADPERQARLRRLSEIQQSAGETIDLVNENVSRLLSNADDIEALEATQHGQSAVLAVPQLATPAAWDTRLPSGASAAQVTDVRLYERVPHSPARLTIQAKSVSLLHQSLALHRGVQEVRRTECCRMYKMNLLCGLGCALTTAGVTVLVLVLTHVITITINPNN